MTSIHLGRYAGRQLKPARREGGGVLALSLLALLVPIMGAVGYISYALWPRWSGPLVAREAPALPIASAGVVFNVPPAAIRMAVQRHAGAQERIDLTFLWPSLEPPDLSQTATTAALVGQPAAPSRVLDRIFVTISAAGEALAPDERVRIIYPRYLDTTPTEGPAGLTQLAFRAGTPYQTEDLLYSGDASDRFLVRCTRNGTGSTPGMCLYERRIERADAVVRFPRDWLAEWPVVAGQIDQLLRSLRPAAE
jgi:hypothetical protein